MSNRVVRPLALIVTMLLVVVGFRFVTQAGQGLNAVQNDGYAGTGGVMLLLGGFLLGYLPVKKRK